jgi:N-acetylneuraminic acid mutarotase
MYYGAALTSLRTHLKEIALRTGSVMIPALRLCMCMTLLAATISITTSGVTAAPTVLNRSQGYVDRNAPHNVWTVAAAVNGYYGLQDCAATVVGSTLYVVGGLDDDGPFVLNYNQFYNPATNVWTLEAPIPEPRGQGQGGSYGGGAAGIGGLLYYVGGSNFHSGLTGALRVYNPATNSWQIRAPLATPIVTPAVAQVRGMLYVVGGNTNTGVTNAGYVYDPALDLWASIPPMPTARSGAAAVEFDGLLFVIGGYISGNEVTNVVETYDPATQTWAERAPMPTARGGLAAGLVHNVIYAEGGYNPSLPANPPLGPPAGYKNEVYNPATDTWSTRLPLPRSRGGVCGAGLNGQMYVIGGGGLSDISTVIYTP